jgi:predicted RNA polymerase sigma factor
MEPDEELIPLNKQDRTLWDRLEIAEGIELLTAALSKGAVGLTGEETIAPRS